MTWLEIVNDIRRLQKQPLLVREPEVQFRTCQFCGERFQVMPRENNSLCRRCVEERKASA